MIILFYVLLSSLVNSLPVNKETYKVVLTQGRDAQYFQFYVRMPPMGEFTICTWFKVYSFNDTQYIYTYAVNDNNQMIKVWIDIGGSGMHISFAEEITPRIPVGLKTNNWYHICLTHQPDYAAIGLYLNSVLVFCGVVQSIRGYVLPKEGTLILGKSPSGKENSFNGEIYGTNMLSLSTIEKKYPTVDTKNNHINIFYRPEKKSYVTFKSKDTKAEVLNSIEETNRKNNINPHQRYNFKSTKYTTDKPKMLHENDIKKIFNDIYGMNNFSVTSNTRRGRQFKMSIFKKYDNPNDTLQILDHEVPPELFTHAESPETLTQIFNSGTRMSGLSEHETPPPVFRDTKVYGQWTSTKYAGKLYDAIKTFKLNNKDILKNPPPLPLLSTYPYPEAKYLHSRFARDTRKKQINVEILEDNIRKSILRAHEKTEAKSVEIISRGNGKIHKDRIYRNAGQLNLSKKEKYIGIDEQKLGNIIPYFNASIYSGQHSVNKSDDLLTYDPYGNSLSISNKWYNIPELKTHKLTRDVNFGLQELLFSPYQVKNPSKIVAPKVTDTKNNESEVKDTRSLRIIADSEENKLHLLANKPFIVKMYPKRMNHISIFEKKNISEKNFNRNVKLGNALNENDVIKQNEEKISFEGSNEIVPEVNRYFSRNGGVHLTDASSETIPGSIVQQPCEMAKIHDRRPFSHKTTQKANIAKEFVEISYTQCSLDDTLFDNHRLLLIYWNKSPVSLFGGARHQSASEFCGFSENLD